MLTQNDWVLCAGTLPQASVRERIELAARHGFRGVSFFVTDHARARAEGLSDRDLRNLLDEHDLETAEIDPLMSWMPNAPLGDDANEDGKQFFGASEAEFYALHEVVGARCINCVLVSPHRFETSQIAEAFGALSERAAAHDLEVVLEFLPWTQIGDAGAALAIVEASGASNAGVMFDFWHHTRGGGDLTTLAALPPERIRGVQINDAPRNAEADLIAETTLRRRVPGEGDLPLRDWVTHLQTCGATAPIGVEIFSTELAAQSTPEAAARIAASLPALSDRPTPH